MCLIKTIKKVMLQMMLQLDCFIMMHFFKNKSVVVMLDFVNVNIRTRNSRLIFMFNLIKHWRGDMSLGLV